MNEEIMRALAISDKLAKEGKEALSENELAFLVAMRKKDNEKIKKQLEFKDVYYFADKGGSFKFEPSDKDRITVFATRNGAIEEIGVAEFYERFGEYSHIGVNVLVESDVSVKLWDEDKDFLEYGEEEEYVVKNSYHFDEVLCVYKSFVEKK
jgi:hypothetical protein